MDRDHSQEFHKMEIRIPFYGNSAGYKLLSTCAGDDPASAALQSAQQPSVDAGNSEEGI